MTEEEIEKKKEIRINQRQGFRKEIVETEK